MVSNAAQFKKGDWAHGHLKCPTQEVLKVIVHPQSLLQLLADSLVEDNLLLEVRLHHLLEV